MGTKSGVTYDGVACIAVSFSDPRCEQCILHPHILSNGDRGDRGCIQTEDTGEKKTRTP